MSNHRLATHQLERISEALVPDEATALSLGRTVNLLVASPDAVLPANLSDSALDVEIGLGDARVRDDQLLLYRLRSEQKQRRSQ